MINIILKCTNVEIHFFGKEEICFYCGGTGFFNKVAGGTQVAKGCELLLYTMILGGSELLASHSGHFTPVERISGA
jgi:hypothetical protein